MFKSKEIQSPQTHVHERLNEIVEKHIRCEYLKPYQDHNELAFSEIQTRITQTKPQKLILDSCCGTGLSSYTLAKRNPNALVIGLDQSAKRIDTHSEQAGVIPANCLMLRANCEDLWRRCVEFGILFDEHYILYPNPYPKTEHLKRRWHGHPVFPYLLNLSKYTQVRSNWKTYLDEFKQAWEILVQTSHGQTKPKQERTAKLYPQASQLEVFVPETPLTLFERKYAASGQTLYKLNCYSKA